MLEVELCASIMDAWFTSAFTRTRKNSKRSIYVIRIELGLSRLKFSSKCEFRTTLNGVREGFVTLSKENRLNQRSIKIYIWAY